MNDISIFDGAEKLCITKPLRLIELFAGYGSQALALKYLGIPYEHYRISEWATKSIQAYKDMHYPNANQPYDSVFSDKEIRSWLKGRISSDYSTPLTDEQIDRMPIAQARTIFRNMFATNNLGSICSIQARDIRLDNKHTYLLSYSFPCQDLSMAGLRQGMERGSSTRSGLLWEVERLLNEWGEIGQGPDILLMENVPEVVGQKNRKAWEEWIASLDRLGYKSYWEILNATDFGIPQNRRRCFMVSVRGDYYYDFPQSHNIKLRLKDVLESNVDEKYYLSDETVSKFVVSRPLTSDTIVVKKGETEPKHTEVAKTLQARDYKDCRTVSTREGINAVVVADGDGVELFRSQEWGGNRIFPNTCPTLKAEKTDAGCIQVGHLDNPGRLESASRVYAVEGASPTLNTCGGGGLETKILEEPQAMRLVRTEECKAKRRETKDQGMTFHEGKYGEPREDGILNTLTTFDKDNYIAMPIVNCNSKGYEDALPGGGIDLSQPNSQTKRGRVQHERSQTITCADQLGVVMDEPRVFDAYNHREIDSDRIGSLTTATNHGSGNTGTFYVGNPGYRIRKLTEKECFRLMGVKDEDSERVHANQSKSSMYHLAGDSIVTTVLMGIFGEMFDVDWRTKIKELQDDLTKEQRWLKEN